jgi:hypothetical protein
MSKWLLIPLALLVPFVAIVHGSDRSRDIRFRIHMIDPGFSETLAVADLNHDGKPDIISGESWYEAPNWTVHPLRQINYGHGHIDDNTDLAVDVDGDGWIDIVQFSYVAHNIVWLRNPGKKGGEWKVTEIDNSGPTEFAFLVDLNNDGKALELLPEFDRQNVPLAWFELQKGKDGSKLRLTWRRPAIGPFIRPTGISTPFRHPADQARPPSRSAKRCGLHNSGTCI